MVRAPRMRASPAHPRLEWMPHAKSLNEAFDEYAFVTIADSQGRITFASDKFCAISGYSKAELLGRDHRMVNSGHHSKEFFRDLWETINAGSVWHGDIKNRAKDGTCFWAATTIAPCFDDNHQLRQFVAIRSDITEQKRIESELAEKLRLQQLLADLTARFVAVPAPQIDAAITEAQRLVVEAMGLDQSSLWQLNEAGDGMVLTHCWQRDGWPQPLGGVLNEGVFPWAHKAIARGEMICFGSIDELPPEAAQDAAEFRLRGLRAKVTFPLHAAGRVFGALAFSMLGAERVWREEEILELKLVSQILGNIVGRQRAEMREEQTRHELAHAMRLASLGELTSALAHELNQPLAAILSNTQAARRFLADDAIDKAELKTILDDIVRDDKRAGAVIHQLRAMVTKERSVRELCDLNVVVREVAQMMHSEMMEVGADLRVTCAPGPLVVEAARVELQQVFVNLLLNAVHAMKDTAPGQRVVEVETRMTSGRALTSVRDHGPGIPPDRLATVFQPFVSTKPGGLGMGLSICRRIIENHGGTIEASTSSRGGACFSFALPAK